MSFSIDPGDHAFADGPVFGRDFEAAGLAAADAARLAAIWSQFEAGALVGPGVKIGMNARLVNRVAQDAVRIEGRSAVRGVLRAERGGRIIIASYVYVGDDVILSAMNEVRIGEATLIAHGVQVFDNNTHPINARQRETQFRRMMGDASASEPLDIETAPVSIGRRCWIGMNSLVLKGVSIGDDTIVAAGSIIFKSLPAGVIAGGNPAVAIRELTPQERGAV